MAGPRLLFHGFTMSDFHNVLLNQSEPVYSRAALISFGAAIATLVGLIVAPLFFPAAFLHLLFPVAIVAGHIGFRKTNREPSRYKGRTAALFGLYVGYFDLLLTVIAFVVLSG